MAAALPPLRSDVAGTNTHAVHLYPHSLMSEFDFKDNRYPALPPAAQRISPVPRGPSDVPLWDDPQPRPSFDPAEAASGWAPSDQQPPSHAESSYLIQPTSHRSGPSADLQSVRSQSQLSQEPPRTDGPRSSLSYALPPGAARRVVERYSLDDSQQQQQQRVPSRASGETRPPVVEQEYRPTSPRQSPPQERPYPTTPRHPAAAAATSAQGPSTPTNAPFPPIMPLSASPTYTPPVAPKHRAYAQQPTYITPSNAPKAINPVYSPAPQEEVCVECAMRDQDMADVDVTSPGVWERASDVLFEELKQREREDEMNGVVTIDDPSRPRVRGGRLTEQNLKIWLSVNPREPASRQQTLHSYIKSQRALLEAEAAAHAQAMQEAKQLDNRMRDAYSQLRRSAYDMGSSAAPADDTGGVRIKPPASPQHVPHARSHSREITLLENGMIVEHVDVRKEEREARERRRKDEKRARKLSRSSAMDVTSIISAQSYGPLTDSGVGLKPYSRYSQSSSARPMSVLTSPPERPDLPRAYSQASFSDVHSLGSASPRRSRFFGMKNLSAGWKSQDSLARSIAPSGMSGSMVDMHVALQREAYNRPGLVSSPVDLTRRSQLWLPAEPEGVDGLSVATEEKPKKKKKGLAKIWSIVTGSGKSETAHKHDISLSQDRPEDDLPLAPPPPLSYLVSRGPSNALPVNPRHASTPSLPSTTSPRLGIHSPGTSPPTAPSSNLPSPTSSRTPGPDVEIHEPRNMAGGNYDEQDVRYYQEDTYGKTQLVPLRNGNGNGVHSIPSEPDMRQQQQQQQYQTSVSTPLLTPNSLNSFNRPASILSRDKSLPPLPPGEAPSQSQQTPTRPLPSPSDNRPRTVYTYDARTPPPGSGPAHDFLPPQAPFRTSDTRRQSFGGMSSRPNVIPQTVPLTPKSNTYDGRRALSPRYDEFAHSRRSLGRLEHVQEDLLPAPRSSTPSGKRKSKFLSSLLGRKNNTRHPEVVLDPGVYPFPQGRYSGSDGQDDLTANGYATSTSRHSALSMGATNTSNLRMSVTSRKALEDLVSQDSEFVAYRYPSNDQRLDLLR